MNYNIRGFGWLLRQLRHNRVLEVKGNRMLFIPEIGDNYSRLIIGKFNEPETHLFIDKILLRNSQIKYRFIDIGANVGEFVVDYSSNKQILEVFAFEPQNIQSLVIEENIKLNGFKNTFLIRKAVFDKIGAISFSVKKTNQTDAGIREYATENIMQVPCTTIDNEFLSKSSFPTILLIDAEGAELNILKGGMQFITRDLPIIIFEYNHVSKQYFHYSEVETLLGENYKVSRLNSKGNLDSDFTHTWNLVAMPRNLL